MADRDAVCVGEWEELYLDKAESPVAEVFSGRGRGRR